MILTDRALHMLCQGDSVARIEAAAQLTQSGSAVLPHLLEVLHNGDAEARWRAAATLGCIGDTSAIESLILALQDSEWAVRHSAIWSLGALDTPAAREALLRVLHAPETEEQVRYVAALGLAAQGEDLRAAPNSDDERLARAGAAALSNLNFDF
jgi:HEAT repeat protein